MAWDGLQGEDLRVTLRSSAAVDVALSETQTVAAALAEVSPVEVALPETKIVRVAGGGTGGVQSVNYVLPDSGGNVQLTPQNVGAVDEDEELTILEVIEMWNNV